MEKLNINNGLMEFEINGRHTLRFNPSDPQIYSRCMELYESLPELARSFVSNTPGDSDDMTPQQRDDALGKALNELGELDRKIKDKLAYVFGAGNDFDEILDGVSVLSVADDGHTVLENLLGALLPLLEAGLEARHQRLRAHAGEAVKKAEKRRKARRTDDVR